MLHWHTEITSIVDIFALHWHTQHVFECSLVLRAVYGNGFVNDCVTLRASLKEGSAFLIGELSAPAIRLGSSLLVRAIGLFLRLVVLSRCKFGLCAIIYLVCLVAALDAS